jgi:hypothetical protein
LRSQFQDFVLGVLSSLLRIGEFVTAVLDVAPGGVSLGQQVFERFDVVGQIVDALAGRLDDLVEGRLQLGEILAL